MERLQYRCTDAEQNLSLCGAAELFQYHIVHIEANWAVVTLYCQKLLSFEVYLPVHELKKRLL